jgi:hypothetical protein
MRPEKENLGCHLRMTTQAEGASIRIARLRPLAAGDLKNGAKQFGSAR